MKVQNSRTKNVSINATVGIIFQIIQIAGAFISRTFFIKLLGEEYLGVNGLFTNILTILSFAELGIGNAFVFRLYKPLAEDNKKELSSLMGFYKKVYSCIGGIIAIAGLCVVPFLGHLIKESPNIVENLKIIYILFLFNTVISYFVSFKRSLMDADQKGWIKTILQETMAIVQIVAQILILYFTRNYILYLIVMICSTLIYNFISSIVANKIYPFLREKSPPIEKGVAKSIFKDVGAFAVYRFGNVITNGTDNIIISSMIGVVAVGLVSNYTLLSSYANLILSKIISAFTASIGNLKANCDDKVKLKSVFQKLLLITAWLYGLVSVGFVVIASTFIQCWLGEGYVLSKITVWAMGMDFYIRGMQYTTETYRSVFGYFREGKYSALAGAILNIFLSILLCLWIGLPGIFIATPISRLLTIGLLDPILIYKKTFHQNPISYFLSYFGYMLLILLIGLICYYLCSLITTNGWLSVVLMVVIVLSVFNSLMLLCFCRTKMLRELFKALWGILPLKKKK